MDNYLPSDVATMSFLPRLFSLLKVAMAPPMILCPYDSSISMNWIHYTDRGYKITLVFISLILQSPLPIYIPKSV